MRQNMPSGTAIHSHLTSASQIFPWIEKIGYDYAGNRDSILTYKDHLLMVWNWLCNDGNFYAMLLSLLFWALLVYSPMYFLSLLLVQQKDRLGKLQILFLMAAGIAPLSLMMIGVDYGRWMAASFWCLILTVFFLYQEREPRFAGSIFIRKKEIVFLIIGVMGHGWYLTEISAIFLAMGILSGFANGENADGVIAQFLTGAKDMLSAALVVGLAGGIIQILQDGRIIDPILHGMASLMGEAGKIASLGVMYMIQTAINVIIPSGSAKAALTMPIMAPFSDVIGISRQATVLAFQFGDGFTNMITPTSGVLMGALGLARIPYEVWVRWFYRILIVFILLGMVLLVPTVLVPLDGF